MNKFDAIGWLLINLILSSCAFQTSLPNKTPDLTIIPQTISPGSLHSFESGYWQIVDQPSTVDDRFSIIVYAMKLTGNNTLIICSTMSEMSDVLNQPDMTVQLRDNIGHAALLSKSSLYSLGSIEFWAMNFEARNPNSSEINLFIGESDGSVYHDGKIADFNGTVDPDVHSKRTYRFGANQTFEQDDYRIFFYGWAPPPSSITPNPSQIPYNIAITVNATLYIENKSTRKINYLAIQFLPDGQIISKLID